MNRAKGHATGTAAALLALWVVGILLAQPLTAAAQERIDETRDLNADGRVSITNISGWVKVTGWDRKEVDIKGFLGEGTERLDVVGSEKRLEIRVVIPRRARNVEETKLEIRVPKGCQLEVETVSADIEVGDVEGEVFLESVSGEIFADGKPVEIEATSVSGDVELRVESEMVRAESVSGDVTLEKVSGDVEVETVSGDAVIAGGLFERLRAKSVSGDTRFEGALTADGTYTFESHSGTIELLLSGDVDAEFDVSTFSGSIDSDFGPKSRRRSKFGANTELHLTVGDGSASVRVETFSGDVELLQR